MSIKNFSEETRGFSEFIYAEYCAVQRELLALDVPYNDEKDCYVATAKRFPPKAQVLAKKYKRLSRILSTLYELSELYKLDGEEK